MSGYVLRLLVEKKGKQITINQEVIISKSYSSTYMLIIYLAQQLTQYIFTILPLQILPYLLHIN